jgi:hypothetical protein
MLTLHARIKRLRGDERAALKLETRAGALADVEQRPVSPWR